MAAVPAAAIVAARAIVTAAQITPELVEALRTALGWERGHLARRLGFQPQTLRRWNRDGRIPDKSQAPRLVRVLAQRLLDGSESVDGGPTGSDPLEAALGRLDAQVDRLEAAVNALVDGSLAPPPGVAVGEGGGPTDIELARVRSEIGTILDGRRHYALGDGGMEITDEIRVVLEGPTDSNP